MRSLIYSCAIIIGGFLFLTACQQDQAAPSTITDSTELATPQSTEGDLIPNQYLFSFKETVIPSAASQLDWSQIKNREDKGRMMETLNEKVAQQIDAFLIEQGISPEAVLYRYTAMQAGVALRIDAATYERLQRQPVFESVEHDRRVTLPPFTVNSVNEGVGRAQTTPCGVSNAGGAAIAGDSRWIWVVDTGIDLDHPDLLVVTNSTYARSFVGGSANDCNGHGTHCAGTAAAINNNIGVIGVAAGAPVVPIRVLNCSGSGSTSGIIAGLNHVATYDFVGDVVNLSLGGYYGNGCSSGSSYRSVIRGLGNSGTRVCIAAGNSSANAARYQPACINNTRVYTIASMTCGGSFSSFSNYNMNPVDYIATGSSVLSTYLNGGYATLSGTSMATPHVAGICQIRNNAPRRVGSVSNRGESYPIARR